MLKLNWNTINVIFEEILRELEKDKKMCDKTFKTSNRKLKYMPCSFKKWRTREENYHKVKRFYLTGDMTNLYSFIQGSLE